MKKKLLTLLFMTMSLTATAQRLAFNTDAAWDLFMTPTLGAEMTVGDRSTVGLTVKGNYRPWGLPMKMFVVQPEYRYYFSGRVMNNMFVGLGALATFHDITYDGKVYDGIAYGGGVTFGYVFKLTRRLRLDCHAGMAMTGYRRKEYYDGDNYNHDYVIDGIIKTNATGVSLMPYKLGVSLSYIIH